MKKSGLTFLISTIIVLCVSMLVAILYRACFSCPLKGRWVPGTTNNCIKEGSPFNNWDDCSCKEERKVYAKEIEILHINALARLIAKK